MSSTGRPVLTFGNRPKLFQNRLLTSKIISLPCTDNVVYLFNLLSTNFYSATLLKNSFIWLFSECFSELYAQQNLFETLLALKTYVNLQIQILCCNQDQWKDVIEIIASTVYYRMGKGGTAISDYVWRWAGDWIWKTHCCVWCKWMVFSYKRTRWSWGQLHFLRKVSFSS